jgi:O-acetylhomoserine/O-acetylserine sulfhydrylase-like pyridoxal-dependent enzyme
MADYQLDIATRLVHAGERQSQPVGQPVATPIYASTTFTYDSMADADAVLGGDKPGYIYTRYGNPTVAALEEAMLSLEGGVAACAYASGMAALHAALFACELSPGSTILASRDLYGATLDLLVLLFGRFNVKTVTADFSDLTALAAKAEEVKPRALVAETISNPLLKLCDIDACAEIARTHNARLIVDNTFASPYLCRPLEQRRLCSSQRHEVSERPRRCDGRSGDRKRELRSTGTDQHHEARRRGAGAMGSARNTTRH